MEIVSQKYIFDACFFSDYDIITYDNILDFLTRNNYMNASSIEALKWNLQSGITRYVFSKNEDDAYADIEYLIKTETPSLMSALKHYIRSFESPYEASQFLVSNDSLEIFNKSIDYYDDIKEILADRYLYLTSISDENMKSVYSYKTFLDSIKTVFDSKNNPGTVYYMMDGSSPISNAVSLYDIEPIINDAIIEAKIINRFPKEEVKDFLLTFKRMPDQEVLNISRAIMYNYIFNSLYGNDALITLDKETSSLAKSEIKNSIIGEDDVVDIINSGRIEFDDDEKSYLFMKFLPIFINDTLLHKYDTGYVRVKKS